MNNEDAQALKQAILQVITERCTNQLAGEIAGCAIRQENAAPVRLAFGVQGMVEVSADLTTLSVTNLGVSLRKVGG